MSVRHKFLAKPAQWDWMLAQLRKCGGPVAIDTEYYNVGEDHTTAHSALVHVWSVGWPTGEPSARGLRQAVAVVLPAEALNHPAIRQWLESPNAVKWAHNAQVDIHALEHTGGLTVRGVRDSLGLSRWVYSNRTPPAGAGYGLDSLGYDFVGYGKTESFKGLVTYGFTEFLEKTRKEVACECGVKPCRRRQTVPGHRRVEQLVSEVIEKQRTAMMPLTHIVWGHERWARLVEYSAGDVLIGCELTQHLLLKMAQQKRHSPW